VTVQTGEAGDERLAVLLLELAELAAVDQAAMTSRTSYAAVTSVGTAAYSSDSSAIGSTLGSTSHAGAAGGGSVATISRMICSACSSFSARWSATPLVRACSSPPPSSSGVTISPMAAFTRGGPPRKIVPCPRTMTVWSLIAGT
jgi:hypothetical protein